jgi:hypothetical protein
VVAQPEQTDKKSRPFKFNGWSLPEVVGRKLRKGLPVLTIIALTDSETEKGGRRMARIQNALLTNKIKGRRNELPNTLWKGI